MSRHKNIRTGVCFHSFLDHTRQCSGVSPGSAHRQIQEVLRVPYGMPGIKPGLAT